VKFIDACRRRVPGRCRRYDHSDSAQCVRAAFTEVDMTDPEDDFIPMRDVAAAVRVARRALAERIAARTREELTSTGLEVAPILGRQSRLPPVPIK